MPLYNNNEPVPPIVPSPTVQIPPIDTAAYFSNFNFRDNIIGYIDGSALTCTYYNQYLGTDDVVRNSNDSDDATIRQYLKINDFEIRVTSALSSSIDQATGIATVTGEANVYPVITPIVGDVVILPIQDNVEAAFEITNVVRASQFKESAWQITYSQLKYIKPGDIELYDNFVVAEYVFDVKLLNTSQWPVQTVSEHRRTVDKDILLDDIIASYYMQFYNVEIGTFLLPPSSTALNVKTYDPYIVAFWNTYIKSSTTDNVMPMPIFFEAKSHKCKRPFYTILDAIAQQSPIISKICVKKMHTVSVVEFDASFQRHTLRVSGINQVVYPYTENGNAVQTLTVDETPYIFSYNFYNEVVPIITEGSVEYGEDVITTLRDLERMMEELLAPLPDTDDSGYPDSNYMSLLESFVVRAIQRKAIPYKDIARLITELQGMNDITKFYLFPILIILLKLSR